MSPTILILTSSSRHFPLDMHQTLKSAGLESERLESLADFIASPARSQPFLAVLEVGALEDIDRAMLAFNWAETVQPLAPCRFLLLLGSKHISLGEKASRFRGVEVAQLPLAPKNILFKLDLQLRLLASAKDTPRPAEGFVPQPSTSPDKTRVLVFKGPGPRQGGWKASEDEAPQGKVRWRWVNNQAKPTDGEIAWLVQSKEAPLFDEAEEAWKVKEVDADLLCQKDKEVIFSAIKVEEGVAAAKKSAEIAANPTQSEAQTAAKKEEAQRIQSKNEAAKAPEDKLNSRAELPTKSTQQKEVAPKPESAKPTPAAIGQTPKPASHDPARTQAEESPATKPRTKEPAAEKSQSAPARAGNYPPPASWTDPLPPGAVPLAEGRGNPAARAEEKELPAGPASQPSTEPSAKVENAEETPEEKIAPLGPTPDTYRSKRHDPISSLSEKRPSSPAQEGKEAALRFSPPAEFPQRAGEYSAHTRVASPQTSAETKFSEKEVKTKKDEVSPKDKATPDEAKSTFQEREPRAEPSRETAPQAKSSIAPAAAAKEESRARRIESELEPQPIASIKKEAISAREAKNPAGATSTPVLPPEERTGEIDSRPKNSDAERILIGANASIQAEINLGLTRAPFVAPEQESRKVIQAGTQETGDSEHYLKMRLFHAMTLEELGDKNSSWYPVDGYRIYLSAQHRYYGFANPAELFPLWVYEGELAPEFLDQQKAWKFYDRLPISHQGLLSLPSPVFKYLSRLSSPSSPAETANAARIGKPAQTFPQAPAPTGERPSMEIREELVVAPSEAKPLTKEGWGAKLRAALRRVGFK